VSGGRVHINGSRVKPSHAVRPGDLVSFTRSAVDFECTVVALPTRRGPASEAAVCYEEKPESRARREQFAARMKVAAALTPRPAERPDKHERRELRRLRGRD
jgi:ribosome-associated heat shock protein Hsp15